MVSLDTFNVGSMPDLQAPLDEIKITLEPTSVALGPNSFAAVVNNLAVYYMRNYIKGPDEAVTYNLIGKYEYSGTIQTIGLSWNTAVVLLTDGRILTHQIHADPGAFASHVEETIEAISGLQEIACIALSDRNVYFGTTVGDLGFLTLPEYRHETALHHTCSITAIFTKEQDGIIAFIDVANEAFLYHITQDVTIKIPGFTGKPLGIAFDWSGDDLSSNFVVYDDSHVQVYVFVPVTIFGTVIEEVKPEPKTVETLDRNEVLLGFDSGDIVTLFNGAPQVRRLSTWPRKSPGVSGERQLTEQDVEKLLLLHRYREAAQICRRQNMKPMLVTIADRCVQELDIDLAISAYRDSGCYDKVLLLTRYRDIEFLPTLAGHMALLNGNSDLACDWFLKANDPLAILNICSDLLQWEKAIALAETHAPDKVSYACRQHALQLELLGEYPAALSNYEKALTTGSEKDETLQRACRTGIAKVSFRIGDLSKGFALCRELKDIGLMQDCAAILEEGRHFKEAGKMFKDSGNLHKAASMYLRAKEMKLAEDIIEKADSIPLKLQLAAAKEHGGDFKGAVKLYEAAGEYDAMVRLLLDALNRTDLAIEIVDKTRSQEGAKMVAAHFMKLKDFASAIRYLLISNRGEEAFLTARQFNQMDVFTSVVGDDQPPSLYEKIASYYEEKKDITNAARFLTRANQPQKAVDLLLKTVKQNKHSITEDVLLEELVTATVKANDSTTTEQTTQFLLGSMDGVPRDEKYLLDLYLLSGQLHEADRITLLVADHYLKNGDYKEAHRVLFRTFDKFVRTSHNPSNQLLDLFVLVHSHAVSTVMYSLKQHEIVARMLIRICRNIGKFPKDASRFLLSAVLECSKCQFNKSAMEFALVLMEPEHRSIVTQKYESKILNILRKGDRVTEQEDLLTDCPLANHKFPRSSLMCPLCKTRIPFCVLTGMHIIRSDLCLCPSCKLPAIHSEVTANMSRGLQICPMCSTMWNTDNIRLLTADESDAFFRQTELLRYAGEES